MLLTYKDSVMMSKCGIEGPHWKLRTEVFSIDVVRPKKTKFAVQEKKFQRSGTTTNTGRVSR